MLKLIRAMNTLQDRTINKDAIYKWVDYSYCLPTTTMDHEDSSSLPY